VRRHESERRYEKLNHEGIQEVNGILWASPLVDFTDQDVTAYKRKHNIDDNPVAALLCTSGECMCGSFEDRQNLPLIKQYFPEFADKIFQLEWEVLSRAARGEVKKEYCLWANGSLDSSEQQVRTDANQASLMCSDCENSCSAPYNMAGNPLSPAEKWLKENDLSEFYNWPFYCAICDKVISDAVAHRHDIHPFDEDTPFANEWDLRLIDVTASHKVGYPITEPNGWNLTSSHLTTNRDEAERQAHRYYYEDTALSHCSNHSHTWEEYNGGPVQKCTDCFSFRLDRYDPTDPGPVTIDSDKRVHPSSEIDDVHRKLSNFM
jgi:hypothetical protein